MKMLVRIETPWAVYGIEVDGLGNVVRAAPIAKLSAGVPAGPHLELRARQGASVDVLDRGGWRPAKLKIKKGDHENHD